jgi:serine-type D-Ala-D-Ala carboxypeptidase/endopeptidase (penicillin-binding protein 4)
MAHAQPAPDEDEDATGSGSAQRLIAPPDHKSRVVWLKDKLAQATASRPKLGKAKLSIDVVDLGTGEEIAAINADAGMNLASNAKLLTSTAALATLGGGFRWVTTVYAAEPDEKGVVEGDLFIKGKGDPMLGEHDLDDLATDIASRGVRQVDRLVIDASYFDSANLPPHYEEQPKETAAFRAPIASFGVSRSSVSIIVDADPDGAASARIEPACGDYVKITKNEVKSVTTGATRIKLDMKPKKDRIEVELTGQIRWGKGNWEARKKIDDPTRFAGEVMRAALVRHGVKVKSRAIATGTVPATLRPIAAHESPTLTDAVRHMNKHSDNFIADTVLKTLGAETRTTPGPGTWADGLAAMKAYLEKLGLPANGYRADNGSGLFGASEVSAHQIAKLLGAAYRDYRIWPDLVASLPVGGVDGTLAKRWHGHPAKGRVRAKTGTLDHVATLAGYVGVDSEHPLAFAILFNDVPVAVRAEAKAAADDMIDALAAYLAAQ